MSGNTAQSSEPGRLFAGRFELLRTLDEGPATTVYEALDTELGRTVALKLFTSGSDNQVLPALREARAMARVHHENVLAVHDVGAHEGTAFLAIELPHEQLDAWLAREPSPAQILEHFRAAGRGLSAAHAVGLVHHDFQPANVMLRPDGSVAVGNFGFARHLDTVDGEEFGSRLSSRVNATLRYIAPERLDGCPNDARGDQFSFCVALWEALAGCDPFCGHNAIARIESIPAGPRGQPRARPHVVRALRRGLAAQPHRRHPSMDALLRALTQPRPAAAWHRVRQRARPLLGIASLCAVFALGLNLSREAPALALALPSTAELTANAAMDHARGQVIEGAPERALETLLRALPSVRASDIAYQGSYLARVEGLADLMAETEAYGEATAAYGAGIELARELGLDPTRLASKRQRVATRPKG